MPGIVAPIRDILTRLTTMQVQNQQGQTVPLFARVWNDQFRKKDEGAIEYQPLPAGYLETMVPGEYGEIGGGVVEADVIFRIHLGHENYDNGSGAFDQDLIIFEMRDQLVGLLRGYKPAGCGSLTYIHEEPNYDHANVYEYIVDFKANFIDYSGSDYRPDSGKFIEIPGPLVLEMDLEIEKAGNHQLSQQKFNILK